MILAREERKPADDIPVLEKPRHDRDPLLFAHRNRRRRIVLGPIELDRFPVFELLDRGEIVFEDRALRRAYRKFQHVGIRLVRGLPHFGVMRDTLVAYHLVERVGRRDADAADVVLRVTRMDARGAGEGLRYRARRLHACDRRRHWDAKALCVCRVRFLGHLAHLLHHLAIAHCRAVPLTGDAHAQETLRLAVLCPLFRDVVEFRERRLVRAEQGRELCLAHECLFSVVGASYHLGEIAELFRLQDYLAARVGPELADTLFAVFLLQKGDAALWHRGLQVAAVEYTALARAAFHQCHPFVHELCVGRLLLVDSGVIGDGAVRIGKIKLTFFCIAYLDIVEVGEADHGGAAYAACDDAFAYLADDVVRVDVAKPSSLAPQYPLARECKQAPQWLRARSFATHGLEPRTRGSDE